MAALAVRTIRRVSRCSIRTGRQGSSGRARETGADAVRGAFQKVLGQNILVDRAKAFTRATYAIKRFEFEDPRFDPHRSKSDYYLDNKLQLTAQELRGKKLVDNPAGGNSAACHIDQVGVDGSHPLFTDFKLPSARRATQSRITADARSTNSTINRPRDASTPTRPTNRSHAKPASVRSGRSAISTTSPFSW
jgi:cytochrome c peroxidase